MQFDLDEEDDDDEEDLEDDLKAQQNEAPEYKRLIAIHAGKGKGGLDDWLKVDPNKVRRLSLSEQELEKAVITHGKEIVRYLLIFYMHLFFREILLIWHAAYALTYYFIFLT